MTEIELAIHAKTYIDKLANGINPLNDLPLPEGDIANNVHVSRCFFFISGVLQNVIDNGLITQHNRAVRHPFVISPEEKEHFEYSQDPITFSDIARRLNVAASGEGTPQLRYSAITFWLIETGMLDILKSPGGADIKKPTERGLEAGISIESRTGANGPYDVIVYNEAAQHFIVDHIDDIVAAEKLRFEMQGKPWTKEDDALLKDMTGSGAPVHEVAVQLKRNISSVKSRMKKLGLTARV